MKNAKIVSQIQQLDSLVEFLRKKQMDEFEAAQWAKYVCVLSSGLLENSIKSIFTDYATAISAKPIATFIESTIGKIRNPNTEVFISVASAFGNRLAQELKQELADNGYSDAIDSIIRNRHLIVHGKAKDCAVSLAMVLNYYQGAKNGLKLIEEKYSVA